jgi:hypothetical protein
MQKRLPVFVLVMLAAAALVRLEASESLKAIVGSYLQIQAQLAADKIDDIKGPARAIAAQAVTMGQAGGAIGKAANAVEQAGDIKAARDAFGTLSDAVLAAAKAEGWKDLGGVRLAFCPMANKSWLQKEEQIRNPYYGSQMLTCGEFKPVSK